MSLNKTIRNKIAEIAPELEKLAKNIHDNPELGLEEFKACAWQVELLRKYGFEVETPHAGLKAAYFAKNGMTRPCVLFVAEFDALPEIGHACGHNLICSASIGAAIALAELIEKESLQGSVAVAGTPAEEGKGGKLYFIRNHSFDNADIAIMGHPESVTAAWNGFLAISRFDVSYQGKASHAAAAPEQGINALDAVMLLFQGINAWRQHIPEDARIHGIVTEGGVAPNIVPESAACRFYVRAATNSTHKAMEKRFKEIARGASLMTGAKCKIIKAKEGYKAGLIIETLNDEFMDIAGELGLAPVRETKSGRGSSDFGDLSQVIPGIHYYFKAVEDNTAIHMRRFAEKSAAPFAIKAMLKSAEISANLGYRFLKDEKLRAKIYSEFEKRKKA